MKRLEVDDILYLSGSSSELTELLIADADELIRLLRKARSTAEPA